jgi:hypothetical protein
LQNKAAVAVFTIANDAIEVYWRTLRGAPKNSCSVAPSFESGKPAL